MNPTLKYPGSKWRTADWIISHMPPHKSYLEPFFGSGAVLFNKIPAQYETINDIDGRVVQFFRTCREQPDALAEALALTPWAREEFDAAHDCMPWDSEVERARKFAVRCWMSFGSRLEKNGWRSTTAASPNPGPCTTKIWHRVPDTVKAVAERLLDVQIDNVPAVDIIRRFNGSECLIYADPPYLRSTRTLNGDQYAHEMTDADHEELLKALLDHKGVVLLSGYKSDMYMDMLHGWRMVTHQERANLGAPRTECLWINPQGTDGQMTIEDVMMDGTD